MTVLDAIQLLCREAVPDYGFYFDDRQLMNVQADNTPFPLVFFEEYREGNYRVKYYFEKSTRIELYFCRLCSMENDGVERERLREQIEDEAVMPFIRAFNNHPELFQKIVDWKFYTPPPRFDSNEVSIMIQFNATIASC